MAMSVAMRAVPAQVAGVGSIAIASPPLEQFGGSVHPTVLAAAALLGIDEVYAVGGAQAVAMFAYGAGACRPVDMIAGPGNVYTAAAKRIVQGSVRVDADGGPRDLVVLADRWADAAFIAADFVAITERDPRAAFVLLTPSEYVVGDIERELDGQVASHPDAARLRSAITDGRSALVLVDDMEQAIEISDALAPELLEIHSAYAWSFANRVRNAGAVFVGAHSPASLGDYGAGSNNVVPTGGLARHSEGLSVRAFTKTVQLIDYTRDGLEAVADDIYALADLEESPAQKATIHVRYEASWEHERELAEALARDAVGADRP
jgi:histidinol dehydrogenase